MSPIDYFGEDIAKTYDDDQGGNDPSVVAKTVDCLFDLAEGGDCLEFAVGTGRIALPLRAKGASVKGIELSSHMVDRLREKETGSPMEIAIGDMITTRVAGQFSLVFLIFNTIDNLTSQAEQVECFKNAARHLADRGRFVIKTLVPPIQKIPFGETKLAFANDQDHFGIDEFDVATQRYSSNHVWMDGESYTHLSIPFRYAWPSELDLMATIAGLELEHRWSDWDRSAFDRLSTKHISVWRKR